MTKEEKKAIEKEFKDFKFSFKHEEDNVDLAVGMSDELGDKLRDLAVEFVEATKMGSEFIEEVKKSELSEDAKLYITFIHSHATNPMRKLMSMSGE